MGIEYENFEAIRFKIVGQAFLYNQIRKMIGILIDICRNSNDMDFFKMTFMDNKFDVVKAPAEGLYLSKIDYTRFNERKFQKLCNIEVSKEDDDEMEEFRKELVKNIAVLELKDRAFSSWMYLLDNNKLKIV